MGTTAVTTKTFRDLVTGLPNGGFTGAPSDAFFVAESPSAFVAPTLVVLEEPEDAALTLIAARGATGKSILAQRLSYQKTVPLWRLDRDRTVSADAIAARLGGYLGPRTPVERFKADDDAFVVIDALDEARMRVSGVSWGEFLDSLVSLTDAGGHRLVLFGRERVLEDIWMHLSDAGLSIAWYEISHFDAAQRIEYVDSGVERRGRGASGTVYLDARDAVLTSLAGTVDAELSEAFVGYAPVLDAVIALLSQGNLVQVTNRFADPTRGEDRVRVLLSILESLLTREQTKTTKAFEDLGVDTKRAFAAEEQIAWLSADIIGGAPPELDWCPDETKAAYVEQASTFLRDHPFRTEMRWASPVFSAYVAATCFGDPRIRAALSAIGAETGLLFEFVNAQEGASLIDEWQFAALHRSVLAAEWQAVEAVVSIDRDPASSGERDTVTGELVLIEEAETRRAAFTMILQKPGQLTLLGPTSFLSASFPGRVDFQPGTSSVSLGPDCMISGEAIELIAESVEVLRRKHDQHGTSNSEPSVVLEAKRELKLEASLIGPPATDLFEIRVPDDQPLIFPWVKYRADLEPTDAEPDDRAVRFLNMFMTLVRKHGHSGQPAVYDKKLEGRQSIRHGEFTNVIAAMEGLGVVSRERDLIFLEPDWERHRFSTTSQQGLVTLDDKLDEWRLVLNAIAEVLRLT
jgi:hypothetical protein